MLSHRNLTSMVSMLSSVFDMSTRDGVLSVLPLHHTFEFSTGFLTPLSRGAQITYLPELTSDALARAIKNGHVTGMVGVPALWELLHRRIKNRLYERSDWIGKTAEAMIQGECLAARQDAAQPRTVYLLSDSRGPWRPHPLFHQRRLCLERKNPDRISRVWDSQFWKATD